MSTPRLNVLFIKPTVISESVCQGDIESGKLHNLFKWKRTLYWNTIKTCFAIDNLLSIELARRASIRQDLLAIT